MRRLFELETKSEGKGILSLLDWMGGSDLREENWVPPVDIYESETELVLAADLPGVKRENVEVELLGDVLTIRGRKEFSGPSPNERCHHLECRHGPFERSFVIRSRIDRQAVSASSRNGVLRVTLPKAGRGTRRVTVDSKQGQSLSSGGEE